MITHIAEDHPVAFAINPSMENVFVELVKNGYAAQIASYFHRMIALAPGPIAQSEDTGRVIQSLARNGETVQALKLLWELAERAPAQLSSNPSIKKTERVLRELLTESQQSSLTALIARLDRYTDQGRVIPFHRETTRLDAS